MNFLTTIGSNANKNGKVDSTPSSVGLINLYKFKEGSIRDVSNAVVVTSLYTGTNYNLTYYRVYNSVTNTYDASYCTSTATPPTYSAKITKTYPSSLFLNYTNSVNGNAQQMVHLPILNVTTTSIYTYSIWFYLTYNYISELMAFYPNPFPSGRTYVGATLTEVATTYIRLTGSVSGQSQINVSIPLNTWHHLVFTISSTAEKIYLNNTVITTKQMGPTSATTIYPVSYPTWDAGAYFGGFFSEIRVYNRILTPFEISNIYKFKSVLADPVMKYSFNTEDISPTSNWLFRNNTDISGGVYDASLNQPNCFVTSNPTPVVGTACYMCKYDGSTVFTWSKLPSYTFGTTGVATSICFWMYVVSQQQNLYIWNFSNANNNNGANNAFLMFANNSTLLFNNNANVAGAGFTLNTWEHYVYLLYSGQTKYSIYKNGTLITTSDIAIAWPADTTRTNNIIARSTYNNGNPTGEFYLDDFRVYRGELTAANISSIYNLKA